MAGNAQGGPDIRSGVIAVGLVVIALVAAVNSCFPKAEDPDQKLRVAALVALNDRLGDPDPRIQWIAVSHRVAGAPAVCGEADYRNQLGGWSGDKRFLYRPGVGLVVLNTSRAVVADYEAWAALCSGLTAAGR